MNIVNINIKHIRVNSPKDRAVEISYKDWLVIKKIIEESDTYAKEEIKLIDFPIKVEALKVKRKPIKISDLINRL